MKEIFCFFVFFACYIACEGQVLQSTKELTGDSSVQIKESASRSLEGKMGPVVIARKELHVPLIVNGFIITNCRTNRLFRELYLKENKVRMVKFYDSQKALEKFGLTSKTGVLLIKMKKKVLINAENLIQKNDQCKK